MEYQGHLQKNDPMYDYLCREIMPQVGADGKDGFRVFASKSSHAVYIYEDRATGTRVVGKFFASDEPDFERAKRKMYREFSNINEFRKYLGDCHYIAKALGSNESLGWRTAGFHHSQGDPSEGRRQAVSEIDSPCQLSGNDP